MKSSVRYVRHASQSKLGRRTTTLYVTTLHWAIGRGPWKPSVRWSKGQPCTDYHFEPPRWGCSTYRHSGRIADFRRALLQALLYGLTRRSLRLHNSWMHRGSTWEDYYNGFRLFTTSSDSLPRSGTRMHARSYVVCTRPPMGSTDRFGHHS